MAQAVAPIPLTKLQVARRELETAIKLWFSEDDPISAHVLATAAYDIIDIISKKNAPNRRTLLLDSDMIKDEFRKYWINLLKKDQNFFKHADRDPDDTIEFDPESTDYFILFSLAGLKILGEQPTDIESAFSYWLLFHRPNLLRADFYKRFSDSIPIESIQEVKALPKPQFFREFMKGRSGSGS